LNEWRERSGRDNHWWDCVVGAAVAGSLIGVGAPPRPDRPRRRGGRGSSVSCRRWVTAHAGSFGRSTYDSVFGGLQRRIVPTLITTPRISLAHTYTASALHIASR
jgi:hypothetical protein